MPLRRHRNYFGKPKKKRNSFKRNTSKMEMARVNIASPLEGELHIENAANLEPPLKKIFKWCLYLLPNTLSYAKTFFSSSIGLESRLQSTRMELDETKQELKILSQKLNRLEKEMKKFSTQKSTQDNLQQPAPVVVPPPPPPPPPPPVPVPRSAPIFKKSTSSSVKRVKKNEEKPKAPCVSLDDILNVKLKKADGSSQPDKENKAPVSQPRIKLSDITSVTLKPRPLAAVNQELTATPKSVLLTKTLRKTGMKRSPGGTPITSRDTKISTATGPTPEIERALKRKFRSLRTSPLAEEALLRSPQ